MTRGIVTDDRSIRFARAQVVVDFTASWCGPCKKIAPVLQELARKASGKVLFYKVDVDQSRELAAAPGASARAS